MENIKNRLTAIIEHAECEKPACRNCSSYKNGGCTFGSLNEKVKITTPNYSCDNFNAVYKFENATLESLKDLLKDIERVDEGVKNLELLLSGKITENDFVDLVD